MITSLRFLPLSVAAFLLSMPAYTFVVPGQSTTSQQRKVQESDIRGVAEVTEVRNVEDEAWPERMEIEVKNVSGKPVYYLEVSVILPELVFTELDGLPRRMTIPLTYGRTVLMKKGHFAMPDDVPIEPGASYVFKIPERNRYTLDRRAAEVTKVGIRVESLSFGDGTGFHAGGVPFSSSKGRVR